MIEGDSMKNVLLEEFSPICQIQAFVEEDDHCVYFYLWNDPGEEYASIRAGWVRNYGKAPDTIDVAAMEDGQAPMLPLCSIKVRCSPSFPGGQALRQMAPVILPMPRIASENPPIPHKVTSML